MNPLLRLARIHGIQSSYIDVAGHRQDATTQSLLFLLQALGVPIHRTEDAFDMLRETICDRAAQALEPVYVAWSGKRSVINLQMPAGKAIGPLRSHWELENGGSLKNESRLERLPIRRSIRVDGGRHVTMQIPVPRRLPVGCHRLTLEWGNHQNETNVFSAPELCCQGSTSRRSFGLFAPLYALHSQRSWGAGDFRDLADFITWVRDQGGNFVGTLPLLPAFLDKPFEPSPYSPVSRLFWNEFFLDITQVPELATCPTARRLMQSSLFQKSLGILRAATLVEYAACMSLKRQVLEVLCRSFFAKPSSRRQNFEKFLSDNAHVADYARFRAVNEQLRKPWTQWPARLHNGELRDTDCPSSARQYHLYAQWLAHEQMAALSIHAAQKGVNLYLDMPLGTHRHGYDTWRHQELFALDASGGAPPDPVFTQGQDWGFAPIHPRRSREQAHAYIRACFRHHLEHARMLRFDHVMGLHRLYWVPQGRTASQGAYITYPAKELYALLSIESHRHQAVIVGENLGTVPIEVNRSLKRHGISGMFVVQYEARPQFRSALKPIPVPVVASLNTHDMPPFAAFLVGLDIADRHALSLLKRNELPQEYRLRKRIVRSLVHFLKGRGWLGTGKINTNTVLASILCHLGASKAQRVMVNLEDLWLETVPQNTPGTSTKRVNWKRKTPTPLEQIRNMPEVLNMLKFLRGIRASPRRPLPLESGVRKRLTSQASKRFT